MKNRFHTAANDVADMMTRKAIGDCAKADAPGFDSYTVDAGKVLVEARYIEGEVRIRWTIAFKDVTREKAIQAISERMLARLG